MPNGQSAQAPPGGMSQNAAPILPNHGRVIQSGPVRVLCVADVRGDFYLVLSRARREALTAISTGNLRSLNDLAKQANAQHIIHTGDFGFYDESSLERIADKFASPARVYA